MSAVAQVVVSVECWIITRQKWYDRVVDEYSRMSVMLVILESIL